ncbi:hypothetical protein KUTeg_017528 [Tegillarca granosa]|uniref:Uncharacterized protein n=1 Tax=Tegillarca granosa TaxID=220873 RepID=A0ABQ9EKM2_TEGGR|nr:hypothetical protein KUTeg_017528 [Tegillarca granosa]
MYCCIYCFTITYKSENQRQYDLRTDTEAECNAWIDHIKRASYSKVLEQKEELEQKHLHLLQILDSERQAKWHYVQQTEELATEVKKIRAELQQFKKERVSLDKIEEETEEIKKIKKVQSFFRGWLCRRRWKQIVELYIRSPHAESMRKRNSIVFNMVECEEEYNRQLSTLVTCFLRPLRMAASSKKPPITHEDVNSIFLNSETLLFLHQIFLKGLCARLENWPTLVLGDLFDMLLPMLCIYQEYVRNHHYSLQVLAEYKQKQEFNGLVKRYEEKTIPRYIITLHELLAHTPHDHVERQSLEYARGKLEELSRIMHDEVSETENIRKNLSIERMIVEGCDILLDVNQTFVRQGPLLQVFHEKGKSSRGRLGSISSSFKESKKEVVRQVFLFTNHMLLTTRASNGRLHLAKHYGKIPLIDCTLVEDPDVWYFDEETVSLDSSFSFASTASSSAAPLLTTQSYDKEPRPDYNGLDFRLIVDSKSGPPTTIILVASTHQEKIAWCSDISQSSSVTMPQSVRSDPKLFHDDVDIKFSRTLNSCKVPQIRHASVDRLLDRLTDLRFLSIDFLNTFLLTYRVFTTGRRVLDSLKQVYMNPEGTSESSLAEMHDKTASLTDLYGGGSPPTEFTRSPPTDKKHVLKPQPEKLRRINADDESSEKTLDLETGASESEFDSFLSLPKSKLAPIASCETLFDHEQETALPDVPTITTYESETSGLLLPDQFGETADYDSELDFKSDIIPTCKVTIVGTEVPSTSRSRSPLKELLTGIRESSSYTLRSTNSSGTLTPGTPRTSPALSPVTSPKTVPRAQTNGNLTVRSGSLSPRRPSSPSRLCHSPDTSIVEALALSPTGSPIRVIKSHSVSSPIRIPSPLRSPSPNRRPSSPIQQPSSPRLSSSPARSPSASPKMRRAPSPISYSISSPNMLTPQTKMKPFSGKRGSVEAESIGSVTPRSSIVTHIEGSPPSAKAGTVVTSSRRSKRRSSSSTAMTAFAAATAGSVGVEQQQPPAVPPPQVQEPPQQPPQKPQQPSASTSSPQPIFRFKIDEEKRICYKYCCYYESTEHNKTLGDFECDQDLKAAVIDMLEEMVCNSTLLPAEHKAAASILRTIAKDTEDKKKVDLEKLLQPPDTPTKDTFDTLSALDIAEQLTFMDHQIFNSIRSEELLGQAWMKPDKSHKAQHVSRLVVSEIVSRQNLQERVSCIEKWAAIADICRCMHNYNGVLQICAAFVNSSVYRLKKTWEKLSKQTLVSSDGSMFCDLDRCDPPCIPYLGMYLTDLSFIEEGTPDFTEDGLVNFSKMRMVTNYLLDPSRLLDDDQTYKASLEIEPKVSRLSTVSLAPS